MNEVLLLGKITEVDESDRYVKTFNLEVKENEGEINNFKIYLVGSCIDLKVNSKVIVKAKLIITKHTQELCIVAKDIKFI